MERLSLKTFSGSDFPLLSRVFITRGERKDNLLVITSDATRHTSCGGGGNCDDMWFLYLLTWLSFAVQLCVVTLALAAGLYYLAELVEEFSVATGKTIRFLIWMTIVSYVMLFVFEDFPGSMVAAGFAAQVCHLLIMRTFPLVNVTSLPFIGALVLLGWNHYVAFSYFSSKYFALSEILTYFTLFMWLVPFALLVSLSANDNVLPSYADAGEAHPLLFCCLGPNHDVVSHYFSKRSSKKYGLLQALQSAKEYLGVEAAVWDAEKMWLSVIVLLFVAQCGIGEVTPFHEGNVTTARYLDLSILGLDDNCTRPAVEQFPNTVMTPEQRANGGIIVHVLVVAYTFAALSIVCDDYFVPSLESISGALHLSADVAGATFMAAGSSGPELATTVIGVFISKDDIGTSGVIGSAVFNIMLVIGACAFVASVGKKPTVLLSWWPMFRDSLFYLLSISAMLIVISDGVVVCGIQFQQFLPLLVRYEAAALLLLYAFYCFIMWLNPCLEVVVSSWIQLPCNKYLVNEKSGLMASSTFEGYNADGTGGIESGGVNPVPIGPDVDVASGNVLMKLCEYLRRNFCLQLQLDNLACRKKIIKFWSEKISERIVRIISDFTGSKDGSAIEESAEERSAFSKVMHVLMTPVRIAFKYTIPDCSSEEWKRWYIVTFLMSITWIALISYVMVWMLAVIGFTMGISDVIMGFTILAAGVSMPDMLASVAVVKQGYGDMAVSNAIGSNVFDILLCLGLPWFLQTAVVSPGSTVLVANKGLSYMTLSLFSTVIFLLVATHATRWRLTMGYGVVLVLWYFVFIIFALLYELNVFGPVSLPECMSSY
ncbi:unnamed protein product [Notodromas monacha]|uniref:Sodium/calcium exchanger membrane region domain-containing protein n=1 Tax=Notodromas monacha TaxID=399045 RepID=A0A7R9GC52_9CRUS|nr:unnamed protein product [Notodromas monacha]CAG0915748.1 unnamed protein product [Notodromas monacha]